MHDRPRVPHQRVALTVDGVHDLGGVAGFGAVDAPASEPVFGEEWERRAFRLSMATMGGLGVAGGRFRHSIERMQPAHYLSSSYYEHWLTGVTTLVVEADVVTRDELERRAGGRFPMSQADRGSAPAAPTLDCTQPRFVVGQRVRVRDLHRLGHTRAPRYVQGRHGIVTRIDGAFNVPDVEAHSDGRVLDPTYSVRFTAVELWGDGATDGAVINVDLWDCYLEAGE